jgi:hypothetical protein
MVFGTFCAHGLFFKKNLGGTNGVFSVSALYFLFAHRFLRWKTFLVGGREIGPMRGKDCIL